MQLAGSFLYRIQLAAKIDVIFVVHRALFHRAVPFLVGNTIAPTRSILLSYVSASRLTLVDSLLASRSVL